MQVQNATLKKLVQGEKQFRVPIWQRQYTWRRPQHAQLWHDIAEQYDQLAAGYGGGVSGHFLGTFVLSPIDATASGVQTFHVIDGQQRLTTLMLALCALRDLATESQARSRIEKVYLINESSRRVPSTACSRPRRTERRSVSGSNRSRTAARAISSATLTGEEPWLYEDGLIDWLKPPLNLQGNSHHDFYPTLKAVRKECQQSALSLEPLVP